MHWGQYRYQFVPTLDKYRWLEPRHQVHIQGRWDHDKTDALQFAFFNGEGWESWENVWGIWNGMTPRDGEATRRVATIERAMAPFFASEGLGALLSHAVLWRVCQPLAVRRSDALDHRQPQRL